jgi:hypothetical protein
LHLQALIVAHLNIINFGAIQNAIASIIFLGMPRRGSHTTPFPALLAKVPNLALAGPAR